MQPNRFANLNLSLSFRYVTLDDKTIFHIVLRVNFSTLKFLHNLKAE